MGMATSLPGLFVDELVHPGPFAGSLYPPSNMAQGFLGPSAGAWADIDGSQENSRFALLRLPCPVPKVT